MSLSLSHSKIGKQKRRKEGKEERRKEGKEEKKERRKEGKKERRKEGREKERAKERKSEKETTHQRMFVPSIVRLVHADRCSSCATRTSQQRWLPASSAQTYNSLEELLRTRRTLSHSLPSSAHSHLHSLLSCFTKALDAIAVETGDAHPLAHACDGAVSSETTLHEHTDPDRISSRRPHRETETEAALAGSERVRVPSSSSSSRQRMRWTCE